MQRGFFRGTRNRGSQSRHPFRPLWYSHITEQFVPSVLPPLDVVVIAAVLAISSNTSLHSYR